jgi:hypothetical protein
MACGRLEIPQIHRGASLFNFGPRNAPINCKRTLKATFRFLESSIILSVRENLLQALHVFWVHFPAIQDGLLVALAQVRDAFQGEKRVAVDESQPVDPLSVARGIELVISSQALGMRLA